MNSFEKEKYFSESNAKLKQIIDFINNDSENFEAHKIEEHILTELLQIGKSLLSGYFAGIKQNDVGESVINSDGIEIKKHKKTKRKYFSVFGKIDIERQVYWIKGIDKVIPLDEHCNLPEKMYSYYLQDIINDFSVDITFEKTQDKLKKLYKIDIGERQIEELPSTFDDYCVSFIENKNAPDEQTEGELQVMEFDGKGIPIIKKDAADIVSRQGKGEKRQKKKEALIATSYTVDKRIRTAEQIARNLIYPEQQLKIVDDKKEIKAQNIIRFGSLKMPKSKVVQLIEKDAIKRNPESRKDVVVLIDGSPYQEKIVRSSLTKIQQFTVILDIIHVIQYLYEAAHAIYSENGKEVKEHVYKLLISILQGNTGRVIGGLKQTVAKQNLSANKVKTLEKVIGYLANHKSNMQYDKYISKGYPIATGIVESTCKQLVIGRMEGAGMKWSMDGAESMLFMRSISKSELWNDFNKYKIDNEKLRLYKNYIPNKVA